MPLLVLLTSHLCFAREFMTEQEFVSQSFTEEPVMKSMWLKGEGQAAALDILGHRYPALRLRYWISGTKSAWILNEVGKEKPITIGILIDGGTIEQVAILAYRESRGGEIRHPYFTGQFVGTGLQQDGDLDGVIDGIAGATLSVRAVRNVGRYALFLSALADTETSIN